MICRQAHRPDLDSIQALCLRCQGLAPSNQVIMSQDHRCQTPTRNIKLSIMACHVILHGMQRPPVHRTEDLSGDRSRQPREPRTEPLESKFAEPMCDPFSSTIFL